MTGHRPGQTAGLEPGNANQGGRAGRHANLTTETGQDVLYLVHRVPFPPDKGDRIRAYHLLRFLSSRYRVHLATLADEPMNPAIEEGLRPLVARLAVVPLVGWTRWPRALASLALGRTVSEGAFGSAELARIARRWARETRFVCALASASSMVPYLRLPELAGVPAVVDLVDLDSEKWLEYASAGHGPMAWLYRTEGRRLRRLEKGLARWARAITLVSQAEAELYREKCGPGPVHAISNGVDLDYFCPGHAPGGPAAANGREKSVVFVGALDYRPNVDGITWFCQEVWPGIERQRRGVKIYLVGRQPVAGVRRLAEIRGVEVVGTVADVRPYLERATLAVVPLRIARGIQNKVLEAMAMGRPVVASPEPLVGLAAEPERDVLAADTPAAWERQVLRLLDDPALGARLGASGRRYVETHHCWEVRLEPFADLIGADHARAVGLEG